MPVRKAARPEMSPRVLGMYMPLGQWKKSLHPPSLLLGIFPRARVMSGHIALSRSLGERQTPPLLSVGVLCTES